MPITFQLFPYLCSSFPGPASAPSKTTDKREIHSSVTMVGQVMTVTADLIILDISMPKLDGLEVIGRIQGLRLNTRILVLTSQPAALFATHCMKTGAAGYVSKTDDLNEVLRAIKAVMGGFTFFPNLNTASVRNSDIETTEMDLIKSLSDRELTVLQHLAWGSTNKEIGDLLLLSSKTISTYKTRLIQKLNVKPVVYLTEFAKRNNLI